MRVLITGGAGWTAAAIVAELERAGHEPVLFDLPAALEAKTHSGHQVHAGDIADLSTLHRALDGIEAVVHLAVATGEAYAQPRTPFRVNVEGTYNLFAAAHSADVARVVLMSSAPVHIDAEPTEVWRSSPGEDHLYDLTKRLQEEIARDFCTTHGTTALVLRAGHIVDGRAQVDPKGRPLAELSYCRGGWICRHDLARACCRALAVEATGCTVYPVVGARPWYQRFGVARTERRLGFVIECDFAAYTS